MHINKIHYILTCITEDRLRVLSDLQYDTHLYLINRVSISCILLHLRVGELTIDAFPPVQVLWMCCRAGAMGVILGVIVKSLRRNEGVY